MKMTTFGPHHFWPRPLLARFWTPETALRSYHCWPAEGLTTFGPNHFWPAHVGPNHFWPAHVGPNLCKPSLAQKTFASELLFGTIWQITHLATGPHGAKWATNPILGPCPNSALDPQPWTPTQTAGAPRWAEGVAGQRLHTNMVCGGGGRGEGEAGPP